MACSLSILIQPLVDLWCRWRIIILRELCLEKKKKPPMSRSWHDDLPTQAFHEGNVGLAPIWKEKWKYPTLQPWCVKSSLSGCISAAFNDAIKYVFLFSQRGYIGAYYILQVIRFTVQQSDITQWRMQDFT